MSSTALNCSRRDFLRAAAAGGMWPVFAATLEQPASAADEPKAIAAVVTEFRTNSHAEVIVGRWLEGFELDGQSDRPRSRLVALHTDQVPANDISRKLCEKHKVTIYPTIRDALCRGGAKLAVDGVLLIGEHGKYPF